MLVRKKLKNRTGAKIYEATISQATRELKSTKTAENEGLQKATETKSDSSKRREH